MILLLTLILTDTKLNKTSTLKYLLTDQLLDPMEEPKGNF